LQVAVKTILSTIELFLQA